MDLEKYLLSKLKFLHQQNEGTIDALEQAYVEGGIAQIEELWINVIKKPLPDKNLILGRNNARN